MIIVFTCTEKGREDKGEKHVLSTYYVPNIGKGLIYHNSLNPKSKILNFTFLKFTFLNCKIQKELPIIIRTSSGCLPCLLAISIFNVSYHLYNYHKANM